MSLRSRFSFGILLYRVPDPFLQQVVLGLQLLISLLDTVDAVKQCAESILEGLSLSECESQHQKRKGGQNGVLFELVALLWTQLEGSSCWRGCGGAGSIIVCHVALQSAFGIGL